MSPPGRAFRENIETVKAGGHPRWPLQTHETQQQQQILSESKESLLKDLTHLLSYVERFSERCNEGTTVIMNDCPLPPEPVGTRGDQCNVETQHARLLLLPPSVTTSLLSMDVYEIKEFNLGIWIWAVTSVAAILPCYALWNCDPATMLRQVWVRCTSWSSIR